MSLSVAIVALLAGIAAGAWLSGSVDRRAEDSLRRVGWAYGYGRGVVDGRHGRYDPTPPPDGRTAPEGRAVSDPLTELLEGALRAQGYIDVERSSPAEHWTELAGDLAGALRAHPEVVLEALGYSEIEWEWVNDGLGSAAELCHWQDLPNDPADLRLFAAPAVVPPETPEARSSE